ncbi:MAG TPA: PaaI family thioesterase [Rhizobium sp.]|nr:PaaI family thioesterase [Rhizobium sp.]
MRTLEKVASSQVGSLPGKLGFEWIEVRKGMVHGRFEIAPKHLSPHGHLHGATIVALADPSCGFGCLASVPDGAVTFAAGELKANFIGTTANDVVSCRAQLAHAGHTTQVWDAEVRGKETGRTIALFRCAQMLLCPAGGVRS